MKIILLFLFSFQLLANDLVGKTLPDFKVSGDDGGTLKGETWSFKANLDSKMNVIFYVDPDEKDLNEEFSEALKEKNYDLKKVRFYGIINYAATWLPNFILSEALKQKQKKYPDTFYVRDYNKVGVKSWGIPNDQSNVLITDEKGKVLYAKFGKMEAPEIKKALEIIDSWIAK